LALVARAKWVRLSHRLRRIRPAGSGGVGKLIFRKMEVQEGIKMGNSYRKNPFIGITTAKSEKQDKRFANRRLRRINKERLALTQDEIALRENRSVSNVWAMDKDGKIRFDVKRFPELLRK